MSINIFVLIYKIYSLVWMVINMRDNFKHLIYAIKIGGAIIVSVIVLTLLTMPYKYTPSHIMNPNGTTDIGLTIILGYYGNNVFIYGNF